MTHGRELGAAYRTELARGLHELGFTIRRGTGRARRYFEIEGVPQDLIDRWSSRHHQVREVIDARLREQTERLEQQVRSGGPDAERAVAGLRRLRANGQLTPAQDRQATLMTRSAKLPLATHADLDAIWRSTANTHQLFPTTLPALRTTERTVLEPGSDLAERLTEFDARSPAREVRAAALEASAGLPVTEALAPLRRLRGDGDLLELADGTFTTRRHRAAERAVQRSVAQLSERRVAAIDEALTTQSVGRLDNELHRRGGGLTREQDEAIQLACSDRQLTVIEGHAGTGKSTVLTAVAQAHENDGRRIIVTSTAALAAHRLGEDLRRAGVSCHTYSTAALHAALQSGKERLEERTTVIHDEAALASTREQHRLFDAIERTGARLIEVGDPAQSPPVGAGGLWPEIHAAAQRHEAHQSLTHTVRARHEEDRRDQRRFREDQAQEALAGYASRGHVKLADGSVHAEEQALLAAQADRRAGHEVLVIAQTSNEHLDQLNARAQALRQQDGDVSGTAMPVPGRPYGLQAGDEVQVRRSVRHPDLTDPLPNGTTGSVRSVDANGATLQLQLENQPPVRLTREQVAQGDLRLAYVQHPFPAQGLTSDVAHLIVAEHATREGSYVALTRARERTTIHAARPEPADTDHATDLAELATRMSRTEPEVPSVHVPLNHEDRVARRVVGAQADAPLDRELTENESRPQTGPPGYIVDALGPRPAPGDPQRAAWEAGAGVMIEYRALHQIPDDEPRPLGPEPPSGRFQQRLEHRRAEAAVAGTAAELGREPGRDSGRVDRGHAAERLADRERHPDAYEP